MKVFDVWYAWDTRGIFVLAGECSEEELAVDRWKTGRRVAKT